MIVQELSIESTSKPFNQSTGYISSGGGGDASPGKKHHRAKSREQREQRYKARNQYQVTSPFLGEKGSL
jgi:hypothetical protein